MAQNIRFDNIDIRAGFWGKLQRRNRDTTVHAVYDRFDDTGRIGAFDFGWKEGDDPEKRPHIFWDSDVAKWMEGVAYILRKGPDAALEAKVEALIDCIEKNQGADGYFNIYYSVVEPGKRWTDVNCHELYDAGHLMEAAVAWYETTGRDRFLKLMCKYADYIEKVFKIEHSAGFSYPGHEEIELALFRLAAASGEKRYADLGLYFLDQRSDPPIPVRADGYDFGKNVQAHKPVREQDEAVGHSVRAVYLYSAMADAAKLFGDSGLEAACEKLWDSITKRRMYITGGIGSTRFGEAFTVDYDLPNRAAYTESCAAIGLAFFASRMMALRPRAEYADVIERILYNGFLSSTNIRGNAFFYENPLEIDVALNRVNETSPYIPKMPITQRVEVFSCSCCPPNITRFVASVGDYLYTRDGDTIYVNQYMDASAAIDGVTIDQSTNYPMDGRITLKVTGGAGKTLALRIPGWCEQWSMDANGEHVQAKAPDGFLRLALTGEDVLTLDLAMPLQLVEADPRVHENCGRVALMRGPIVYCLEGVDNGPDLRDVAIKVGGKAELAFDASFGAYAILTEGSRRDARRFTGLYAPYSRAREAVQLRFVPYYAFGNRGESDMVVWVMAE